jgi:hypothetical protein
MRLCLCIWQQVGLSCCDACFWFTIHHMLPVPCAAVVQVCVNDQKHHMRMQFSVGHAADMCRLTVYWSLNEKDWKSEE